MLTTKTQAERVAEIRACLDELQAWFAGRRYGWRQQATPGQVGQWDARDREYERLLHELEMLEG